MTDSQTNGESMITSINKPAEAFTFSNELTTAAVFDTAITSDTQIKAIKSSGPDRVRTAPRRHSLAVDKYGEEHLSNQRKQRYWNSWEELFIVELWHRYKDEITVINVPLPVYRKMMVAMRSRNMMVTAQDCRRKINTLNARYKMELKRMEATGCKSDWRLFPLINCVLQPKIKDYDPWHETKIVKKLLDKLPKPVEEKPPPPAPVVNHSYHQSLHSQNLLTSPNVALNQQQRSFYSIQHNNSSNASLLSAEILPSSTIGLFEKPSILPFRNITLEKIEQLRQDNNRLAAQRDDNLKLLHIEEHNFQCLETFIRVWTEQKELELSRINVLTQENVLNLENGENHNMEEQLQETVVAK